MASHPGAHRELIMTTPNQTTDLGLHHIYADGGK